MSGGVMARRHFLVGAGVGTVVVTALPATARADDKDVGAVEDLMREHGILRRALLVYSECAARLRAGQRLDGGPLSRTATLFREFGEDYHERKLEEAHIFPAAKTLGGPLTAAADVPKSQHQRGREITAYIIGATANGSIANPAALARVLDQFVRMYRHHAAREDTVVFTAWKDSLTERQLDEFGDKFEEIEKAQFGSDGFEAAAKRIANIEETLSLGDLAQFTAPAPPRA